MIEAASSALWSLFGCPCVAGFLPLTIVFLFIGVILGLALGILPGLGGLVGIALVLPFTFTMEAGPALALMIGLLSVSATADTVPAVLFGVPGTAASQATILDGYPMSKKGEADRALGAAYTASVLGGVLGAVILGVSIPLLRPLVLAFGSPEFFMLGLLGIAMVASLSGSAPVKGLVAGAIGLLVGSVGMDPQSGVPRWATETLYLWDGVPLVAVALGLFAIPEIVDVLIKGTRIADVPSDGRASVLVGIKDTVRHKFLVARCSVLGTWIGAVPGLGAAVVDWFAYGHALQSEKGARATFGKGDVRGVIAPESANNAKEAGALVPTLAFGVPGSAAMALLMGGMLIQGITPGRAMLDEHLDITYSLVWSIPIANIMGAGICILLSKYLAKIAMIRIHTLAPIVISLVFLASYQASRHIGDLIVLLAFSAFGWLMKRFRWPRPPLVLGLVLSLILERNLFISISRFGSQWLQRPIVIIIGLMVIATLGFGVVQSKRPSRSDRMISANQDTP